MSGHLPNFVYVARHHSVQELLGLLYRVNLFLWSAEQCSLMANVASPDVLRDPEMGTEDSVLHTPTVAIL